MGNRLPKHLTLRDSFLFPIETPEGRRDILLGGLAVLLLLPIGWILNLGARLDVVHRLHAGSPPYFRGMRPWRHTFRRGCVSAVTIFFYLLPANISFAASGSLIYSHGWKLPALVTLTVGVSLFILGVFTLPGCMTVYACEKDPSVLFDPARAFRRAWKHRGLYAKAWGIALLSILTSFFGLLALGIGFFFTSAWAWEVVGYAFTVA